MADARLPGYRDSWGWLMLYNDALRGDCGEAWQRFAEDHVTSGRTDGTSWKKWRDECLDTQAGRSSLAGGAGGDHVRSYDPDAKPLHYCATCYQDWPCQPVRDLRTVLADETGEQP